MISTMGLVYGDIQPPRKWKSDLRSPTLPASGFAGGPVSMDNRGKVGAALVLQPHAEHHHGRLRARERDVGIEDVVTQRALDPEIARHLVDQVGFDRIGFVPAI